MQILHTLPPNFAKINAKFNVRGKVGVIFCYGANIHNPSKVQISPALIAHEKAHSTRQIMMDPEKWWDRYIDDVPFRFDEELIAHRAEYGWWLAWRSKQAEKELERIAGRLAGPLYGDMCTLAKAKHLILQKGESNG